MSSGATPPRGTPKTAGGGVTSRSRALQANLRQTAVNEVFIDPRQEILRAVFLGFPGILNPLDQLLRELNHPFRNWRLLLPELRGFVLKNAGRILLHPNGPACFDMVIDAFFKALDDAARLPESPTQDALEGIVAFLEKSTSFINEQELPRFEGVIDRLCQRLGKLPLPLRLLLGQIKYPLQRTISRLIALGAANPQGPMATALCHFLPRVLEPAYDYWLSQSDPAELLEPGNAAIDTIGHKALRQHRHHLQRCAATPPSLAIAREINALPHFVTLVLGYRQAAAQLAKNHGGDELGGIADERLIESHKLRFLFHIMEIEGLAIIHEETLREINRSLVHLVQLKQRFDELEDVFLRTFEFLKISVVKYPHTALNCIEALGMEVFRRNNSLLVEVFLEQAVRFGFQATGFQGVDSNWQPICNANHLYNIRVWLALITRNTQWSSTLLSALVIHLRLTGTCIRDTDLFQKEITHLLNSGVGPVFNLFKQFSRLLPVYYNEIGAEGELREVSTELDELTRRQDRLIHFLRKQCHVESTNLIVDLAREILDYWLAGDPAPLVPYVAAPILAGIRPEGPHFIHLHQAMPELMVRLGLDKVCNLLALSQQQVADTLETMHDCPVDERRRLLLMIRLYQLLHLKYNPDQHSAAEILAMTKATDYPGLDRLDAVLHDPNCDLLVLLETLLDTLEYLKKEILLANEQFPAVEEIFQKRHVAVDIPSVYGQYRERKFDALSLTFRLESLTNIHLEQLVGRIPEGFITRAAFFRIAKYLKLFLRALDLEGIHSRKLHSYLDILERSLEHKQFSYSQYMDVFQGLLEGIRDVVRTYYTSQHIGNMTVILPNLAPETLLPRYRRQWDEEDGAVTFERIQETFTRDLLATTLGLTSLDRFVTRVVHLLARQRERLAGDELNLLLTYDPANLFCPIFHPMSRTRNLVHLGNKGFNLVMLADFHLPVPDGVILTTEYYRCQRVVQTYAPAQEDFLAQLRQQVATIEASSGMGFGAVERPLLLSVRSGALVSMPGMMQTIHNVGLNESLVQGILQHTGNPYFAWDTYRRFIQSWCMTFHVNREAFSQLMHAAKQKAKVKVKRDLHPEAMADLARAYLNLARQSGIHIPDDPWEQLLLAIEQVINSWNLAKAREYRRLMGLSDRWGTAVVLQRMVFGNRNQQSGSGVLLTAHPHRRLNRVVLWGDYTVGNQGEDVVGGLVAVNPVSVEQCRHDQRHPDNSLERRFPDIYRRLLSIARFLIYQKGWNPQEMEFTFDGPREENLHLLQTRDMMTGDGGPKLYKGFQETPELAASRLGRGIGVAGGTLCGKAVFNLEQIQREKARSPHTPLILIRYDTVPEDIKEISEAQGLLTARGGQTSHAAIVAARLNKVCVVGCEELVVKSGHGLLAGVAIAPGDPISLDGFRGLVLKGWHPQAGKSVV